MTTWLDALLDTTGLRPASVTWAAILGVVAGSGTLMCGVIVVGVLSGPTATWGSILAWTVAATQVAAAVLLLTGGERLAVGAGRTGFVAGAVLHLLVCAAYLLHALTVVAHTVDEPPSTARAMTAVSLTFAALSASGLILALRPTTTEYLALYGNIPAPRGV